jgi:hypothetical protein
MKSAFKMVLWAVGVLALLWGLKTELPAMKRYIKIERM